MSLFDILRAWEKHEMRYCVVYHDSTGRLVSSCGTADKVAQLAQNLKHGNYACLIEIGPSGPVSVCDSVKNIRTRLSELR